MRRRVTEEGDEIDAEDGIVGEERTVVLRRTRRQDSSKTENTKEEKKKKIVTKKKEEKKKYKSHFLLKLTRVFENPFLSVSQIAILRIGNCLFISFSFN